MLFWAARARGSIRWGAIGTIAANCVSLPKAGSTIHGARWRQLNGCGGLVTPLGRQLNGCLGTIVRVDTAAKRYVVKVDNFGLKSIKPENLDLTIEPLNRVNSRG